MMMDRISEKPVFVILILALLAGYLFFFRLGAFALTDPDEAFYAQTAKEMLARNEWATPYLYGSPQFEKPILFYWLVEASFKLFGVNEFAARFPSALFACFGLIAIYFLGAAFFNKRAGLLAAVMTASSVEYIVLSRACVTDMVLFVFMLFGATFFCYGRLKEKNYFYFLSAASFALATLTKGPIAIILPLGAIIPYLLFTGGLKAFRGMPVFRSALVFLVIAAPWYLVMYKLHGRSFIDGFFGFHNVTRFLEAEHKIGSQFYYNIPIVFGGFFPWSVFLPFGFWHAFRKIQKSEVRGQKSEVRGQKSESWKPESQNERNGLIFALLWFSVIFIFFSISSTKLPTYIFPSFLGLALVAAVFWDDFLKESRDKGAALGMKASYYALLAAVVLGAIGATVYLKFDYPVVFNGVLISCISLVAMFILSLAAFINKKFIGAFFLIVCSVLVFLYPLDIFVLPQIERYETSKDIAQKLTSFMKKGERLGSESNYLAGLAFYTGVFPVDVDKHHILVRFLDSGERVWCVLKEKNHRQLYELDSKPYYTKPSYTVYRLGKKVILTNMIPDDGVYIRKRERVK